MAGNKKTGIWMDHSVAYLTELRNGMLETSIINSLHSNPEKGTDRDRSGNGMEQMYIPYYRRLGEVISNYDEVVLFGPTDARLELLKILRGNYLFSKIKIELKQAPKMSRDEQHDFFRDHFKGRLNTEN
ncbi:MAG: hypothetical protein K0S33_971 [Bacteroidetes bacterium]|jgi:hypothetical protein|nr:hypothetical protein [Bacteroidota bacterium]